MAYMGYKIPIFSSPTYILLIDMKTYPRRRPATLPPTMPLSPILHLYMAPVATVMWNRFIEVSRISKIRCKISYSISHPKIYTSIIIPYLVYVGENATEGKT